jgi:hypothetical protein
MLSWTGGNAGPLWAHSYIRGPSDIAVEGVIIMVDEPPVPDKYPILETGTRGQSRNRLRFTWRLYLKFQNHFGDTQLEK